MVSEKQLIANRENGKKGGPKTKAGKAVVKYNALKHGLLCQEVVIPGENRNEFDKLKRAFATALDPQGPVENMLFDIIVSSYWRLRRAVKLDGCYIETKIGIPTCIEDVDRFIRGGRCGLRCDKILENPTRYETTLERRLYKALHELQRVQMLRKGERPQLPVAIDLDVSHEV